MYSAARRVTSSAFGRVSRASPLQARFSSMPSLQLSSSLVFVELLRGLSAHSFTHSPAARKEKLPFKRLVKTLACALSGKSASYWRETARACESISSVCQLIRFIKAVTNVTVYVIIGCSRLRNKGARDTRTRCLRVRESYFKSCHSTSRRTCKISDVELTGVFLLRSSDELSNGECHREKGNGARGTKKCLCRPASSRSHPRLDVIRHGCSLQACQAFTDFENTLSFRRDGNGSGWSSHKLRLPQLMYTVRHRVGSASQVSCRL